MAGGGIRTYTSADISQGKRTEELGAFKEPALNRIREYLARIGRGTESQKARARGQALADVALSSPPPGFSPGRSTGADLFKRQQAISGLRARAATMSGDRFDIANAQQKLAAAKFGRGLQTAVIDGGLALQQAEAENRIAIGQNKATVGNAQAGLFGSLAGAAIGLGVNNWDTIKGWFGPKSAGTMDVVGAQPTGVNADQYFDTSGREMNA